MEMVYFIPPSQRRLVQLAAQTDTAPVLISGASGTGKGGIAKWLHANGPRAAKSLISATREKTLSEQLLAAQGGTLLIPELGEWPLGEQKVLLELFKTKTIPHPDGSGTPMLLNVRIIATTDQALDARAQGGLFNAELLEKLNVFRIEMPPLSKRPEEFEDIAIAILGEITREVHKEYLKNISPAAWDKLSAYEWPGNIRELRNVLRLGVVAAKSDQIEASDLPEFGHDQINFRATREQFEKIYLLELLNTFNWEIDKTCQVSRLDKPTLLKKMTQYGIEIKA
jgi:DNA-binding NtrC family response regulator